jgi:hypothetical protein
MSAPRAALALTALLYLSACEEWHLSINSNGLVFISVIGDNADPKHRFRLRSRDARGGVRILDVPASGQLTLTPVSDGTLELTLLTPDDCRVAGSNPRTLTVAAGQEVRLAFEVRCT